jgi:hypothetical protein
MYGKARESLPLQELNPDITTFIPANGEQDWLVRISRELFLVGRWKNRVPNLFVVLRHIYG